MMTNTTSPLWRLWLLLLRAYAVAAQDSDARSLSTAIQNINGMSSVFSLLPVLTGKTQNVKAIAARTFPGSLTVAGLGAGRVLSKIQIGIMLLSADLYRNLVGELSYYHQEYVNVFSPPLIHIPTGTPERHSSNVIINHNPTEDYMIEAWFQTQGLPAKVELKQTGNRRMFCGLLVYLALYTLETFLCVQNGATGTSLPLIVMQTASGVGWIAAVWIMQITRGQGKRFINVNRLATAEYRCYQLIISGKHVHSALFSTELSNIRDYNLFDSKYESKRLKVVGGVMIASGMIDIFATVLIVGLNIWAYGWLGLQVVLIVVKVFFSLEPIRRIPIVKAQPLGAEQQSTPLPTAAVGRKTRLPIIISAARDISFVEVRVSENVVLETETQSYWSSRSPGLFIGQPYYLHGSSLSETTPEKSAGYVLKDPLTRISLSSDRPASDIAKALFPLASSPPTPTSPTSGESPSTVEPSSRSSHAPDAHMIIRSESPLATSPVSPVAPPGIPPLRSVSSSHSLPSARAPTPVATQQSHRTATLPAHAATVSSAIPTDAEVPRSRPKPSRSHSQTLVDSPRPTAVDTQPSKANQEGSETSAREVVRYLALNNGELTLSETEPARESNQALQREFLACLAEVVKSNKVPSLEFLIAIETMREGIRRTMSDDWYAFGTTDLRRYLRTAHQDLLWRRFL